MAGQKYFEEEVRTDLPGLKTGLVVQEQLVLRRLLEMGIFFLDVQELEEALVFSLLATPPKKIMADLPAVESVSVADLDYALSYAEIKAVVALMVKAKLSALKVVAVA